MKRSPTISTQVSSRPRRWHRSENKERRRASVLLEVVLALALFVGAATIISSGINASVQAVYRLRLETHAANLAISVLSEMQMHARPISPFGPEPFEAPFTNWTCRVELTQSETAENDDLRPVEVIVSHLEEPIVYRLTQLFRSTEIGASGTNTTEAFNFGGAL